MAKKSNAGPFEVGVDQVISPDEKVPIPFSEVAAGPEDKEGWLRKLFGARGGMDYVFVVNNSGNIIAVESKGGRSFVPPATSQTLDTGPYNQVGIVNAGGSDINTGTDDSVKVEVGNMAREERQSKPSFSLGGAVEDIVPGVRL